MQQGLPKPSLPLRSAGGGALGGWPSLEEVLCSEVRVWGCCTPLSSTGRTRAEASDSCARTGLQAERGAHVLHSMPCVCM